MLSLACLALTRQIPLPRRFDSSVEPASLAKVSISVTNYQNNSCSGMHQWFDCHHPGCGGFTGYWFHRVFPGRMPRLSCTGFPAGVGFALLILYHVS